MTTKTNVLTFPTITRTVPACQPQTLHTIGLAIVKEEAAKPEPTIENAITVFVVGMVYHVRSIGDNNCIWNYKVISRTPKMVTLQELGESKQIKCRVYVYDKREQVKPHGSYSMCAILLAEKVGEKRPDYSK
jgi:hypothetical protein